MHALLIILAAFSLASVPGPVQDDADEILAQLSKVRLDKNQIHHIRDITIRRDVISISFNRGTIAFLEPIGGRVTGAVFVGSGEILVIPPDPIEKRQLNGFTGSPILNERFTAAMFRFTDDMYAEILEQSRGRAQEEVRAQDLESLLPWEQNIGDRSRLLNYRLLTDLLGSSADRFFFAEIQGEKLGWFDAIYDQMMAEEVAIVGARSPSLPTSQVWASFNRRSEARDPEAVDHEDPSIVDALRYEIDTTIRPDTVLEARADITVRARTDGERVLTFDLTRTLRVTEVLVNGLPAKFYQHALVPDSDAYQGFDSFVVVLPGPMRKDEEFRIRSRYTGRVLEPRGEGIYFISERSLWYPNVGMHDPATFDLTFHYPVGHSLIATGDDVERWEDAAMGHSRWTTRGEFFVAGFNYGDFTIEQRDTGSVPLSISLHNEIETALRNRVAQRAFELEESIRAASTLSAGGRRRGVLMPVSPSSEGRSVPREYEAFSTLGMSERVLDEIGSSLDFFAEAFGPYPYGRLVVSQFPVPFSQGWPSLLYISTFSFMTPEQWDRLGLTQAPSDVLDTEFVRAHEVAHQWFGNMVSWHSYRDQWIMEALANYAGAMYLEEKHGADAFRNILDQATERLLTATGEGRTHDDNGPLWLGYRLSTTKVPNGYVETVYHKGTLVVHMLRMLMRDPETSSDERFLAMVRHFLEEFQGRAASTFDLKNIAESHMTDRMDVSGEGTLDWFFDQWVFGTGVPEYELTYSLDGGGSRVTASGRVQPANLPDFIVPVPLYARTGAALTYLGDVVVEGEGAEFFFALDSRPDELVLDPYHAVLRRGD